MKFFIKIQNILLFISKHYIILFDSRRKKKKSNVLVTFGIIKRPWIAGLLRMREDRRVKKNDTLKRSYNVNKMNKVIYEYLSSTHVYCLLLGPDMSSRITE
ncbi:hypothetical protein V1478_004574 [Vespula squamosa]|uniref:Uncharacterized protein n=1 Tax=Vespula squamosa TaxID=30214 RepID=A0ABD2BGK1_VESSQ